jgi:hypothetical protein
LPLHPAIAWTVQGILAAVFSTVLGSKDPDQVAVMAKQAGEVSRIGTQAART